MLEAQERNMAKAGEVGVLIELHFSKDSRVLPTGATIPDGFTKKITQNGKTTHYYFPNERPTKNIIQTTKSSTNERTAFHRD